MTNELDCRECGACCFGDTPHYVPVTGDDHQRLGEVAAELAAFDGTKCFMRMEDGHCAALQVSVKDGFTCSIYAQRPATCRELERGSPACHAERDRKLASSTSRMAEQTTQNRRPS